MSPCRRRRREACAVYAATLVFSRKHAIMHIVARDSVAAKRPSASMQSPVCSIEGIDVAGVLPRRQRGPLCARLGDAESMCGIAGIIDCNDRRPLPVGILQRMAEAIVHRG